MPGPRRVFGQFCKKNILDVAFDNTGISGIKPGPNTIDYEAMEATLEWTRPFDVSADGSLALDTDTKYYMWITWVSATDEDDFRSPAFGMTGVDSYSEVSLLPAPDAPVSTSSQASFLAKSISTVLALILFSQ